MKIHVICDVSGSMAENAKLFIMRTIVMSIAQWIRLDYMSAQVMLYGWVSGIQYFPDWNINKEFPQELLTCNRAINDKSLEQWLDEGIDGKVLFLTDGFLSKDEMKALKHLRSVLSDDSLRIIKIGADANPYFKEDYVFLAEDLFAALDGWSMEDEAW